MSYWQVSNHKLYSGSNSTDVSNPVFIVGTEFGFGWDYGGTNWTGANQKSNRALAGNAVRMWGNGFGPADPVQGATKLLSCFSQNPGLNYFIPDIDEFNRTGVGGTYPRGQHSYVTNQTTYVTNGHWGKTTNNNFRKRFSFNRF